MCSTVNKLKLHSDGDFLLMKNMPALFISKMSHLYTLKGNRSVAKIMSELTSLLGLKAVLIIASVGSTSTMSVITEGLSTNHSGVRESTRNCKNLDYSSTETLKFSQTLIDIFMAHGLPIISCHNATFDVEAIDVVAQFLQRQILPIVQISVIKNATPSYYYQLGQALANLKSEGVLIVGSGSLTCYHPLATEHNQVPDWVIAFETWMQRQILLNNIYKIIDYRKEAPFAIFNHPTEEEIMPLFVIMGAMEIGAKSKQVYLKNKSDNQLLDGFVFS